MREMSSCTTHELKRSPSLPTVLSIAPAGLPEVRPDFESLLAEVSSRFANTHADRVNDEIEESLRLICSSLEVDVSAIYLREVNDPETFSLAYVLRDPPIPPFDGKLTSARNFPWFNRKVIANETVCLPDTQTAPPEASIDMANWKNLSIASALLIPLSTGGQPPVGIWNVGSTVKRDWPEPLRKRLKILAEVFSNALARAYGGRQLHQSETRLGLAANVTGAGFWTIDLQNGTVWATPKLEEMFGLKPNDLVDIARILSLVHPDDREPLQSAINSMAAGNEATLEFRVVPSDGPVRWVLARGNRYEHAEERAPLLMGITIDITERRAAEDSLRSVSGRLIEAQEQERKRIARELHDSIGQHLAMISIGLQEVILEEEPASDGRHQKLTELLVDTQNAGLEVHALSHKLHSSSLDSLGLVPAIEGLCAELRKRHHVTIDFKSSGVPDSLNPELSLALFRITQEALHNALKHSGVTHYKVRLKATRMHLELTVNDAGAGFDVRQASQGQGLGLISMRERVAPFKGEVVIRSRPGHGTEIRVRLPIDITEPLRA
jgi:PAS domain S-box-containing protein